MKENERTLQFKENFFDLWLQGCTLREATPKFNISFSTAYRVAQQIADAHGVPREALLSKPHAEHLTYNRAFLPVKPVDLGEFKKFVDQALNELERTCKNIEEDN